MGKVPDRLENLQKCICGECPSFNRCMRDSEEILFCARNGSKCAFDRKGCLCGKCPLSTEFGLHKVFYCATGAED